MLLPTCKWAQRPNVVYLTIDVQDSKDPQVELTNTEDGKHGHLKFTAKKGDDAEYELDLTLYAAVDKEKSKINISPRSIFLVLEKETAESWPRLTKEPSKHLTHIKVDWDKWVDSDDEGDDNFDPSSMGDMMGLGGMGGGMGGLGGMNFEDLGGDAGGLGDTAGAEDSDDEDLPELEA